MAGCDEFGAESAPIARSQRGTTSIVTAGRTLVFIVIIGESTAASAGGATKSVARPGNDTGLGGRW